MNLEILSPEKKVFEGEALAVAFPGASGQFQVLNNHAALISSLVEGDIVVKTTKEETKFSIKSGFVEVMNNNLSVLIEE